MNNTYEIENEINKEIFECKRLLLQSFDRDTKNNYEGIIEGLKIARSIINSKKI